MCAITGVVRYRLGAIFSIGDWVRAADAIGLSFTEAGLIVTAADAARPLGARMIRLRKRLLVAAHIDSSSPAAATRPEAMDPVTEQHTRDEEELIPA